MPKISKIVLVPNPLDGSVWHCMSPVGQLEDSVCFVYLKNSAAYLWLNGVSYLLPDSPVYHPYPYKVILTNYIWLIEQSDGIKVHQYQITDGKVSLINTVILGDSNGIWGDVILLQSGKLVVAWWQKPGVDITDIEIHLALGNEAGWSEISAIMPGSHLRQNKIALAQHPTDGAIWYFQTSDSRGVLKAMSLVEKGDNLEVTRIEPYFIPYKDELRPNGEIPTVRAIPDAATQSILVAYQNKDYYAFSWDIPICKGANINVISVKSNGAISLRGVLKRWVERISNFSLGIADGQFWLAFGEIDAETLKWNILKVYYEDGSEKYLGQLKALGFSQGGLYMTNSTEWVIGTMEDDYIHFFNREANMQVIIDVSTWTQAEKNYLQAAAVALLWKAGITYDDISARNGVIDISNPSADVSLVLTEPNLKAFIVAELEKIRIANEEALVEAQAREAELVASEFTDIKLAKVDTAIDAIKNLAELKVLLKKFVRYVIARV